MKKLFAVSLLMFTLASCDNLRDDVVCKYNPPTKELTTEVGEQVHLDWEFSNCDVMLDTSQVDVNRVGTQTAKVSIQNQSGTIDSYDVTFDVIDTHGPVITFGDKFKTVYGPDETVTPAHISFQDLSRPIGVSYKLVETEDPSEFLYRVTATDFHGNTTTEEIIVTYIDIAIPTVESSASLYGITEIDHFYQINDPDNIFHSVQIYWYEDGDLIQTWTENLITGGIESPLEQANRFPNIKSDTVYDIVTEVKYNFNGEIRITKDIIRVVVPDIEVPDIIIQEIYDNDSITLDFTVFDIDGLFTFAELFIYDEEKQFVGQVQFTEDSEFVFSNLLPDTEYQFYLKTYYTLFDGQEDYFITERIVVTTNS